MNIMSLLAASIIGSASALLSGLLAGVSLIQLAVYYFLGAVVGSFLFVSFLAVCYFLRTGLPTAQQGHKIRR